MGYFANGFVFWSEPDFKAASMVAAGRLARGYKHKQHPVWLLDLWKPRGKLRLRCAPFCDPAADGFCTDVATLDQSTCDFLAALDRLKQAAGHQNADPEQAYVHLTLAIAQAVRCPTFLFAADDDEMDMGCTAAPGSLMSFGCRLDRLSVQYNAGQVVVTPLNFLEDGDDQELQELVDKVKNLAGLCVLSPREIEGGQILYEHPVAQWPQEAGDPAEILGLGTWDPLQNLEEDFTVVFEHLEQ